MRNRPKKSNMEYTIGGKPHLTESELLIICKTSGNLLIFYLQRKFQRKSGFYRTWKISDGNFRRILFCTQKKRPHFYEAP